MAFPAKAPKSTRAKVLIPPAEYQVVCYQVLDLGTQENPFEGDDYEVVRIAWEISQIRTEDDRPASISVEYRNSMDKKANLRKLLESWSGRKLTHDEINKGAFHMDTLLGVNAKIYVIEKTSERGNQYPMVKPENVSRVSPNEPKLVPENEFQYFSFAEDGDIPDNIPEYFRDLIMASPEYHEKFGEQEPTSKLYPSQVTNGDSRSGMPDDEIPF